MQVNNVGYTDISYDNFYNSNPSKKNEGEKNELSLEDEMDRASVQVTLSMNAQIVLFSMDSSSLSKNNTTAQNEIFTLLSGEKLESGFDLSKLGYEGKSITELSENEAKELIDDNGFFGVDETSNRVANFVFDFAGYDLALLEKGRSGIVQGFEEAQKLWNGELPEISYRTQESTLALLDARIADLKAKENK